MRVFLEYFRNPFRCLTVAGILFIAAFVRIRLSPHPQSAEVLATAPFRQPPAQNPLPAGLSVVPAPLTATNAGGDDSFAVIMARIHFELREWMQTRTGDRQNEDRLENELLAMLTDANAARILQRLSPEEMDTPLAVSALFRWMKADPLAAADWIAARADATEDQAWVVARNLLAGGIDLENYSVQLPDDKWKQTLLADGCVEVISKNPREAVNLAQQMNAGPEQTDLLRTIASDWISNDPNSALNWIMSVTDPSLREQLIVAAAKAYASVDPRLAAEWLTATVKPDGAWVDALSSIMAAWAAVDPSGAANWEAQIIDVEGDRAADRAYCGPFRLPPPSFRPPHFLRIRERSAGEHRSLKSSRMRICVGRQNW